MIVHPKIGFHCGVGGNPTGIGEYIRTLDENGIPATIVCTDGTTGLGDALTLIEQGSVVPHVLCWRRVMGPESNGNNEHYSVPDYNKSPHDSAVDHWNLIKRAGFPQEVEANKDVVWLLPINEVDKNRSDWIGRFSLYFAQMANAEGWKVAMPAWTAGEPKPEHWKTAGQLEYLRYCEAYPHRACVALHEYSYTTDGLMQTYPYLLGRFTKLFGTCDLYGIQRPKVIITEFGWTLDNVPPQQRSMSDLLEASAFYAQYPEVLGCALWNLGPYLGIENKVQPLIKPITQMVLGNSWEIGGTEPPPTPSPINQLGNASFEGSWYHPDNIPELQIPNLWEFNWETGRTGFGDESWDVWVRPEVRVFPKEQLPPQEHDLFILDGSQCLKVFKGSGAIAFDLSQVVTLNAGRYELLFNVFPDLVMRYENGQKVFADDPLAGEWSLIVINDDTEEILAFTEWEPFEEFGRYNQITQEIELNESASVEIVLSVRGRFALQNNGFFFDAFSLKQTNDPVEPPPPSNIGTVVYILRPERLPPSQESAVLTMAHEGFPVDEDGTLSSGLHTLTFSFTDAKRNVMMGNGRSLLLVVEGEQIGTGITPEWMEANHPLLAERTLYATMDTEPPKPEFRFEVWPTQYKTVTQPFGANPDYYGQFGLPGHEGVDIRATHGSPLYAMFDGVISDVRTQSSGHNYGIFVRVRHESGYEATYAHMKNIAVAVGDSVLAGDLIGTADNTGNSNGDHLHLTLKHPDARVDGELYIGYPHNIVDPTSFLEPLLQLDAPEPPYVEGWGWLNSLNIQGGGLALTTTAINLRSLPFQSANKFGTVPAGTVVIVDGDESGGYLPIKVSEGDLVVDEPEYTGPDWPVCYFGVHDRASRHPLLEDAQTAEDANFNSVKHMSGVTNGEVMMYNIGAMPFRLCRLFETWNNRHVTVQQFVDAVVPDIRPLIESGLCEYFELHNEPNLTHEGLQAHGIYGSWEDGAEFAQFFIEAKNRLKAMFPNIKIGFPGVSPGPSTQYQYGHDSGWRMDHREFLAGAREGIELADFVGVHCYYGDMLEVEGQAIEELRWYRREYPNKLLFVTEHGNPTGSASYQKGQQVKRFHELAKRIPGVGATYYFLVSGDGWDHQALRYNSGGHTPIFNGLVD